MNVIEPAVGTVLVRLSKGSIPTPEKSYDSVTNGEIIAVNPSDEQNAYLIGRTGYWAQFKDEVRVGDNMAFILVTDIRGTTYERPDTTATN